MVIEAQIGADAGRQCDLFHRRAGIIIEPSGLLRPKKRL